MAVSAWNIAQVIGWQNLPVIAEMLGVRDVEMLIARVVAIHEHTNKRTDQ